MTTASTTTRRMPSLRPKRWGMLMFLLGWSGSCGVRVSKSGIWFLFHTSGIRRNIRAGSDESAMILRWLCYEQRREMDLLQEAYERVLESYGRAKEDLESADERTQDALRLIKDAL